MGGANSTSERYLACGFDSGDFKIVDLRMMKICYEKHFANGVVSIDFDRAEGKLNNITLGCLEGHIYSLDCSNGFEHPAVVDYKLPESSTVW